MNSADPMQQAVDELISMPSSIDITQAQETLKIIDDKKKETLIKKYEQKLLNKNIENFEQIQKEVFEKLLQNQKAIATEMMTTYILKEETIKTIRDDEKTEIWIYKQGIYLPQGKTYIQEYLRIILMEAYTPQLANIVISKIETDTYINQDDFFNQQNNNPHIIPVENGLLNIETGDLDNFNSDQYYFNKLPVIYNKNKDCQIINKFMTDILEDENSIKTIQEYFGFCLLKQYKYEKSLMLTGAGRNGKTKLLELLKRTLGIDNCSSISLQDIEKDVFILSNLQNKLVNMCGDISNEAIEHSGKFKDATGRGLLTANRKFKTPIKFENYAKMIFSANEIPMTKDLTLAFFDRWIIIEFPFRFLPLKEFEVLTEEEKKNTKIQDPNIIDKITTPDELSGFLNWLLEGYQRLREQKDFSYNKTTNKVKDMWIRKSDSFTAFAMDVLEEDFETQITKEELRKVYTSYCKKYKLKAQSDISIKNTLTKEYGVSENQNLIGEKSTRCWNGIRFKNGNILSLDFIKLSKFNPLFFDFEKQG